MKNLFIHYADSPVICAIGVKTTLSGPDADIQKIPI